MTSWSASSTPELLRSCEPLPPVGYRRTPCALSTPFTYRNARISFEPGAGEFDSMYTVPLTERGLGLLARSDPEAGEDPIAPTTTRAATELIANLHARTVADTAQAYR